MKARNVTIVAAFLLLACGPGEVPAPGEAEAHAAVEAAAPVTTTPSPPAAATRGLDSVLLAGAFDRAAELPRLYSLLVARHGEIAREEYYHGRTAGRLANMKSASKSVISALVGIAIAEGHLEGLDQPIAPFFPSYIAADADGRIHEVTIGDLLSMRAGLEPTSFGNYGRWVASRNWVHFALRRPFVDDPGGRMLYSTGSTHILSAILTRATGVSTLAYAREKLFRPLGIQLAPWTRDPQGIYFGGNEMHLRPRELFTFAELYRNGGVHDGRQVLSEEWIRNSWTRRTTSPFNGHGYGLGWWMRTAAGYDVYFAWGYGGQYAFIVPALELTVVTTSDPVAPREGGHNRTLHDLIDDFLIPAALAGDRGAPFPPSSD